MRGLPKSLKIKLLESDPTPTLDNMVAFVHRFRAVQGHVGPKEYSEVAEVSASDQDKKIDELVAMVNVIACKQQSLEECLTAAVTQTAQQPSPHRNSSNDAVPSRRRRRNLMPLCYNFQQPGHLARDCRQQGRKPIKCSLCNGYGHISRNCANNLNGQGAVSPVGRSTAPKH